MTGIIRRFGGLAGMLAVVLFFAINLPETFLTARNWLNISQQVSMLAVVAATMTVVMVMGDFDLSVGSMASLAGVVAAVLFVQEVSIPVAILAALGVGLLGGLFNGVMVSLVGILPFVATLATLTVFSGIAFVVSDGRTIFGRDIPAAFGDFARGGPQIGMVDERALILPNLTLVAVVVIVLIWIVLEQTSYGRRLYAIGGNSEAARLAGLPVMWLRLSAFAFTGVGAALAGLMYASRVASANPTQGDGLMLTAIAAVFLGMTLTRDGQPRVLATLAGVLVLGVLDNGLTQMRVDSYVREVLVGAIILIAVGLSALGRRGLTRRA
ncbi:ABC transporter permease [Ponticoccus sp. SC2-23]|uniref:ABC transporter permease n=1 Tax=Alexandriicola marinus TaxID=2081710 RepID=UPI000FDC6342|nr:ABC transporter permease [Alexandriicola marinus]MBM1218949.1 ABC transporter permease [Ponticoccus sp. SC6-9]MBM1223979.1 ABC transporter permease [Ponticoccus sp. SC6-15]MBM1230242.1 ABC transporter permease [Ponticoccus sp. SC6-38]MBM1232945.1 ABC transporter permease [Ponticoccus sp. SC6-45]MBM1237105.1 ABC transporter permease [Ponticoccus sp. SC6-49]MBM1241956.1 ABC transporter permease [Ponticoccus sp. SC2-64]MBM1246469.1 ABC transporter permease [Ponticoccus sp. SC6-42]MBM1250947